jgi:hypothetical protein
MRPTAFLAVFVCAALIGCAEKTESQRISDAAKAEIAQRGEPTQINCRESPDSARGDSLWVCSATLQHPRTRYATCGFWEDPEGPVGECRFFRRRPKHPEILVIR